MGKLLTILSISLAAAGLVFLSYLPPAFFAFYEYGILGLAVLICLLGLFVLKQNNSASGALSFLSVLVIYCAAGAGVFYLGGPGYRYNPALLVLAGGIVGISVRMEFVLAGILYNWILYNIWFYNQTYRFLPGSEWYSSQYPLEKIIPSLIGLTIVSLFFGYYMRIKTAALSNPGFIKVPSGDPVKKNDDITGYSKKDEFSQATPAPLYSQSAGDTQIISLDYLVQQEIQKQENMKSILDAVVYFMSKNFKSLTAIGFLVSEDGTKLYMNAVVTKSSNLNNKAVIQLKKGLVGRTVLKSTGFVSGDLKSYPDSLEYYLNDEDVNSVMVMPVKNPDTGILEGALVVDSNHLRAFTDEHKELLRRFTQIASAMIANTNLTHKVHQQALWADTLYEVTRTLTKVLKIEEVISILGETVSRIFTDECIVLSVYNARAAQAQIWNVWGKCTGLKPGMEYDIQEPKSLYGYVFRKRKEIIVTDLKDRGDGAVRFNSRPEWGRDPEEVMIIPVFDERQSIVAVLGIESFKNGCFSDKEMKMLLTLITNFSTAITKARVYGELEKLATIDGLTQIANHRKFQETLSGEFARTQRFQDSLSLLLMDIDHFKKFNDTYGHPAGDAVLKSVAAILKKTVRGADLCARYGGEEFVVIVIKAQEDNSLLLAERIRKSIEAMEVRYEDKILKVTMSIGSASFPGDASSKQELIDLADKALYASKENGRNRITPYSAIGKDV